MRYTLLGLGVMQYNGLINSGIDVGVASRIEFAFACCVLSKRRLHQIVSIKGRTKVTKSPEAAMAYIVTGLTMELGAPENRWCAA